MRTEKSDTIPNYNFFHFNPWRYCSNCGMCHKDMMKCYKRAIGNWKKEISDNRDGFENESQNRRYEPEGRSDKTSLREEDEQPSSYGRKMQDGDRFEEENRYKEDGPHPESHLYEADGRPDKISLREKDERPSSDGRKMEDGSRFEDENRYEEDGLYPENRPYRQTHVHEYAGSTKLDEFDEDVHNHRVAGITGEALRVPGNHIHKVWTRTDFFDHFHYIEQFTGPAVYVEKVSDEDPEYYDSGISEEPHIHFVKGLTSINHGHNHEFQLATLIDSPLLPEPEAV